MTDLLKRAFDKAAQGPEALQDAIAALILAELESEQRWDESFGRSQDALKTLGEEVHIPRQADHRSDVLDHHAPARRGETQSRSQSGSAVP